MIENFAHLATRVFNTPIAIHPAKAEVIMAAIADRLGIADVRLNGRDLGAMHEWGDFEEEGENPRAGYDVVAGVAIIPVRGTLVQRLGTLMPYSGMTGYDGIRQNFLMALDDKAVEAVCLDIDSPGGEVAGCFDLVDTIHAARGVKPIASILSEAAYSAAFALATACDPGRLSVPRTGGTGSVGVIYNHVSYQGMLEKAGVEVTLITKGDLKGEGNEFQNLSAGAFKRIKADVEAVGELFDATVARNRGLSASEVFDTQAATYLGGNGVDIGFADRVAAPDEAFRALLAELG
jgi:ClpP class serine protease